MNAAVARPLEPHVPAKDRLSIKLALLFVASFLVVFILLAAWTMMGTIADRQQVAAASEVATPVIVIDPRIQSDLAKALAFDAVPTTGEVLNPFVDRAGIGSNLVVSAAPVSSGQTAAVARPNGTSSGSSAGSTSSQTLVSHGGPSFNVPTYDTKARHDDWMERQKRGEAVEAESEVLAIEDLVPVGYASGGDRGDEVMLFSLSLCRTFTFPAGTRFANGWLNGFDQREVVFTFQDGLRRKSYANAEQCQSAVDQQASNVGGQ